MKKQRKITERVSEYPWLNFGLIAAFLMSAVIANGQARVRPELQEKAKVEIYRTMEDMLNDKADQTITVDYAVFPKEHGVTYHRLLVNRKEGKAVGRVFAFRVSNEVFINPRKPKLRKGKNFYKNERIGGYINYATVGEIYIPGNQASLPYRFTYPREELMNTETGKRMLLTRARLKWILKKDNNLALWKEFRQEKRKSSKLIPYLKEHEATTAQN
jgi:hypothetical protein